MTDSDHLVTVVQMASIMGKSESALHKWIKEGAPVAVRANRGKIGHRIDTREFLEWYTTRQIRAVTNVGEAATKEEAQRRKLAAEAELVELELAKKKGQVIEIDDIERQMNSVFAEMRAAMRKVPERCVIQIIGEKSETKIKKIIRSEIDDALNVLSEMDIPNDE